MVFTHDDYLPSYEEFTVPEITMTAAPLKAGAIYFGKYCDDFCKEYMLCSKEEKDPRKCLREGKAVTACGVEFYNKVKANCAESFTNYWKCLDDGGPVMDHMWCKNYQAAFSQCVKEKIGVEEPYRGYFSKVRVVKTTRPKPHHDPQLPEAAASAPEMEGHPDLEKAKDMSKHGNRNPFF